jgi:hypothetical protein
MATRYHYDLYPRTDPRDGARITRFTKLQRATYRDVIGVGSGAGVIRSTDDEADSLDPRGEQFVRVVREDTVAETEATIGGFWINNYKHDTAVARQTKRLTFAGAGTMAYLARVRMAPHTYIHDVFTGQDPFDGLWRLYAQSTFYANGNYLGAMLWRVIYEAQHWRNGTPPHRHKDGETYTDTHPDSDRLHGGVGATAIPDLVLGFDQFEDSDGNAWTAKSGEFTAAIGENVLSVTKRLMEAGLYVEMDPVTFELRAWEDDEHRRDRTGGAWGASVVRFQAPTDGTVATGNMLSDSEREINSHLKRTAVWAGSGDTYALATGSSDIPWEGFESADLAETDALEQLAATQIQAREEAADAGSVRMKLGATPLSGRYRPWEEVRLDDLVTLDTGSGVWDYTEDTYPVAGLRIELQKSGAWWAWAELGASQPAIADRRFQVAPVGPHPHPPNPELCRVGFDVAFSSIAHLGEACSNDGTNPESDYAPWGTDNEERVEITIAQAAPAGTSIIAYVSTNIDGAQGALYDHQVYDEKGNTWVMDDQSPDAGSNDIVVEIWRCNVTTQLDAGDYIRFAMNVGSSLSSSVEIGRRCIGAHLFSGTLSSPVVGTSAAAFNNTPTIGSSGTGGLVVAGYHGSSQAGPDADWEETVQITDGSTGQLIGQFLIPGSNESYTPTPALGSHDWAITSVAYTVASGSFTGDGPLEIVGTSIRASRCDHNHYHGDLLELDEQDHPASAITIADSGAYYTGTDVEAALQEIGAAGGGISELDDVPDVDAPSPADGDVLTFDSGSGEWINAAPTGGGGGGAPSGIWTMSKTASQTLTSNADTTITFDRSDIDSGSSVIDLANDRFVAPLTGKYLVTAHWIWETTAPNGAGRASVAVNGTIVSPLIRLDGGTLGSSGGLVGTVALSLTAGDLVTLIIHPGAAVTPTARGNASRTLSSAFTLAHLGGGGTGDYMRMRLVAQVGNANTEMPINTTSYAQTGQTDFYMDWDQFPATHFRLSCFGHANAASQTITFQLAAISAPATPLSAGGNDFVVANGVTNQTTGWIAIASAPLSGRVYVGAVAKGSTATVDFAGRWIDIEFKIDP